MFLSSLVRLEVKQVESQLQAEEKKQAIGIAIGIIFLLGGLFLAFASHQIFPGGVNAISELGQIGQLIYGLTLTIGAVLISLSSYLRFETYQQRRWDAHNFMDQAEKRRAQPEKTLQLYCRAALTAYNGPDLPEVEQRLSDYLSTLSPLPESHHSKAASIYQICAEGAYEHRNFDLALRCFEQAENYGPLCFRHTFFKILSLLHTHQVVKAKNVLMHWDIDDLKRASDLFRDISIGTWSTLFALVGQIHYERGQFALAHTAFKEGNRRFPLNGESIYLWMLALAKAGMNQDLCLSICSVSSKQREEVYAQLAGSEESQDIKNTIFAYTGYADYYAGFNDKALNAFEQVDWSSKNKHLFLLYIVYLLATLQHQRTALEGVLAQSPFPSLKALFIRIKSLDILKASEKEALYSLIGGELYRKKDFKSAQAAFESCLRGLNARDRIILTLCYLEVDDPNYEKAEQTIGNLHYTEVEADFRDSLASIYDRLGEHSLVQYRNLCSEEQERGMFDAVINAVGSFFASSSSRPATSESFKNKALDYYTHAIDYLSFEGLFSSQAELTYLLELSEDFRETLLKEARSCGKRRDWERGALMYLYAMTPPRDVDFFASEACKEASVNFLRLIEGGIAAKRAIPYLQKLVGQALLAREDLRDSRNLSDPTLEPRIVLSETPCIIIDLIEEPDDIFVYELGYRLYYLKAQLLEAAHASIEEVYEAYQHAFASLCQINPQFTDRRRFLSREQIDATRLEAIKNVIATLAK